MGTIRKPLFVKLFTGMLSGDPSLFDAAEAALSERYGPVDLRSGVLPWPVTDYYRNELGDSLLRKFIFFERPADPGDLASCKMFTNELEDRFAVPAAGKTRRRINIDPGYVTEAKVVLASTKDFSHRVYLGAGIYAEATLEFHDGAYVPTRTTYPEFRSDDMRRLFSEARVLLRRDLGRK